MDAYLLTAAKISIHFGNLVVVQADFLVGQSELFLHVLAQGILVYKHVDGLGTYVAFRHVQVAAEVIAVGSPRVLGDVVLCAVLVLGNAGEGASGGHRLSRKIRILSGGFRELP